MSRNRKKILEAQLTPQQRKAARLIVDNEWGVLTEGKKMTMQEIANQLSISRTTLYEWKRIEAFNEYVNYLTDQELSTMRGEVNVAIMKLIRGGSNGVPSVKAIDLFMRRFGLLTDRQVVEDNRETIEHRRKTDEEIAKEIADLDEMINSH
ncbi:phBC6A51 family helix-turn-helix protein [Marinicrinis sediminis]|uniref:PhBC6A51 family helix-turn-helix protein n=1 Tax=Marinicrinis sediminis TaxID=1652465 RepID=A0ABW5RDN5_9BACL